MKRIFEFKIQDENIFSAKLVSRLESTGLGKIPTNLCPLIFRLIFHFYVLLCHLFCKEN